jgi:hypothetical protein
MRDRKVHKIRSRISEHLKMSIASWGHISKEIGRAGKYILQTKIGIQFRASFRRKSARIRCQLFWFETHLIAISEKISPDLERSQVVALRLHITPQLFVGLVVLRR